MNCICFIENAQPEGHGEGSGHSEAELLGEFHIISFLKEISKLGMKDIFIPPANEVAGLYSVPYVRPLVRPSVRPSILCSNPLLL